MPQENDLFARLTKRTEATMLRWLLQAAEGYRVARGEPSPMLTRLAASGYLGGAGPKHGLPLPVALLRGVRPDLLDRSAEMRYALLGLDPTPSRARVRVQAQGPPPGPLRERSVDSAVRRVDSGVRRDARNGFDPSIAQRFVQGQPQPSQRSRAWTGGPVRSELPARRVAAEGPAWLRAARTGMAASPSFAAVKPGMQRTAVAPAAQVAPVAQVAKTGFGLQGFDPNARAVVAQRGPALGVPAAPRRTVAHQFSVRLGSQRKPLRAADSLGL